MALILTRHLHHPFDVALAKFRAKTINIIGPRLFHTETSKSDHLPDLDPRLKVNLKVKSTGCVFQVKYIDCEDQMCISDMEKKGRQGGSKGRAREKERGGSGDREEEKSGRGCIFFVD